MLILNLQNKKTKKKHLYIKAGVNGVKIDGKMISLENIEDSYVILSHKITESIEILEDASTSKKF